MTRQSIDTKGTLVNSVIKALNILECFSPTQRELKLSQISSHLGIPKSTALNLIRTLESKGYLIYSPHSQTYQLGYNVMTLSYNLRTSMPIIQYALPFLEELQVKTGEIIYLTTHVEGQVLYLEGVYPSVRIGNYSIAGKRLPMHCTSCGKAMLAYLPDEEFEEVLHRWKLPALTPNTITTREQLESEIENIRDRGYAIDCEEETLGIKCVAVAIRDATGYPCGAISVSGTTISMRDELLDEYAKILSRVCSVLITTAHQLPAAQMRPSTNDEDF
jgi:DNA-binding IclR family transcriptional regulator